MRCGPVFMPDIHGVSLWRVRRSISEDVSSLSSPERKTAGKRRSLSADSACVLNLALAHAAMTSHLITLAVHGRQKGVRTSIVRDMIQGEHTFIGRSDITIGVKE